MANIENKVNDLLKRKVNSLGYDLYDVEYTKEGKDYFLRVYIDNEKGIDLNDCEKVSNEINGILDEADLIKEQYFLEVSSPGIERILRRNEHLKANIGKNVEIKLFKPIEKQKQYVGELIDFSEDTVDIKTKDVISIDRKNIAQIKTVYDWDKN